MVHRIDDMLISNPSTACVGTYLIMFNNGSRTLNERTPWEIQHQRPEDLRGASGASFQVLLQRHIVVEPSLSSSEQAQERLFCKHGEDSNDAPSNSSVNLHRSSAARDVST